MPSRGQRPWLTGRYVPPAVNTQLSDAEISQVTDIIPGEERFRFAVGHLTLKPTEYSIIYSDAQGNHHDTVFGCITRWKIRIENEGKNAKVELSRILTKISKERGWFTERDIAFITGISGISAAHMLGPGKYEF